MPSSYGDELFAAALMLCLLLEWWLLERLEKRKSARKKAQVALPKTSALYSVRDRQPPESLQESKTANMRSFKVVQEVREEERDPRLVK